MAMRKPPSQRPGRQLDPAAQEAARLADEEKAAAKKALKAERKADAVSRPTHVTGGPSLAARKGSGGGQPPIRRSKSGGGG